MKTAICFALAMIANTSAIPANYGPPSAALVVGPAKPYSYAYEVVDPTQSGNAFGDGMSFLLFSRNGMCMPSSLPTSPYRVNILHSCLCTSMSSRATPLKQ